MDVSMFITIKHVKFSDFLRTVTIRTNESMFLFVSVNSFIISAECLQRERIKRSCTGQNGGITLLLLLLI